MNGCAIAQNKSQAEARKSGQQINVVAVPVIVLTHAFRLSQGLGFAVNAFEHPVTLSASETVEITHGLSSRICSWFSVARSKIFGSCQPCAPDGTVAKVPLSICLPMSDTNAAPLPLPSSRNCAFKVIPAVICGPSYCTNDACAFVIGLGADRDETLALEESTECTTSTGFVAFSVLAKD